MKGRKIIVQKAEHAKNNKRAFHIIKTHACCYKWFIINVYYKRSITNEFIISRCSKLIAYMNLIKKVMLSNASTPSFGLYAQLSSVV